MTALQSSDPDAAITDVIDFVSLHTCVEQDTPYDVSIPVTAFAAVNPKLDLRAVLLPFIIADRYANTGKAPGSGITTKINVDAIYRSK